MSTRYVRCPVLHFHSKSCCQVLLVLLLVVQSLLLNAKLTYHQLYCTKNIGCPQMG
jgi:hypothetical protein